MSKGINKNTTIKTVKMIQGIGPKVDWSERKNRRLVDAFLALENKGEAEKFLRDLMTESEIQEFANRLEAARLLSTDEQYKGIIEKTGLSSTTIARIAKWLNGSLGGYRLILTRLNPSTTLRTSHHNSSKLGKGLYLNS
ncbi:MAG: YerC/YecD family TrpR-related protein [Candidatus Woesebacteria bacterium]|nr:YerC/YecD family TrpR-related protein [Candidatus Woesebacteria bacterium]